MSARTGLTLTASGEETSITCPAGHTTPDWRPTREAVRGGRRRGADRYRDLGPGPDRDAHSPRVRRHVLTMESFFERLGRFWPLRTGSAPSRRKAVINLPN